MDVGLKPTVVPMDDWDAREDVCEELIHQEVVEDPRVKERFVRKDFSYSEAFFSNLDPVGDSEDDSSQEAEDSKEELELDDEVKVSEEELERDEFIEVWVSFLDIPLEHTHSQASYSTCSLDRGQICQDSYTAKVCNFTIKSAYKTSPKTPQNQAQNLGRTAPENRRKHPKKPTQIMLQICTKSAVGIDAGNPSPTSPKHNNPTTKSGQQVLEKCGTKHLKNRRKAH
ncbi:hypothetical protein LIER_38114 [Lithospermum erythrorhizon]|uniref:Uncharacterized protein n=1 Tax=Lithospermum erythrorhizon TaxID=34254 RepID=A0AAV3PV14_LITER